MELDIPRQQKVPRLVTGLSQRRLTRGNFIKHLASDLYRRKNIESFAGTCFRNGSAESFDLQCLTYRQIESVIQEGSKRTSNFESEFFKYSFDFEEISKTSSQPILDRFKEKLQRKMFQYAKRLIDLGGHVACFSKILKVVPTKSVLSKSAGKVVDFYSTVTTPFIDLMELESDRLEKSIRNVSNGPSLPRIVCPNWAGLSLLKKKCYLQKQLLMLYQRSFQKPEAKRVPWGKIYVTGWPENTPFVLSFLCNDAIEEIKRKLEANDIKFSKNSSTR